MVGWLKIPKNHRKMRRMNNGKSGIESVATEFGQKGKDRRFHGNAHAHSISRIPQNILHWVLLFGHTVKPSLSLLPNLPSIPSIISCFIQLCKSQFLTLLCCRPVLGEINLLKYFQQQRLEHTILLRKEITRLEKIEKVYLSAIKKVCSCDHYPFR